jgi:hypothetical protein
LVSYLSLQLDRVNQKATFCQMFNIGPGNQHGTKVRSAGWKDELRAISDFLLLHTDVVEGCRTYRGNRSSELSEVE